MKHVQLVFRIINYYYLHTLKHVNRKQSGYNNYLLVIEPSLLRRNIFMMYLRVFCFGFKTVKYFTTTKVGFGGKN